jgi:hypothetical protein
MSKQPFHKIVAGLKEAIAIARGEREPAKRQDVFRRYLFEYRHAGLDWGIEIVARSRGDAQERLKAISMARYKGEVAARIPVPGGSFLADEEWEVISGDKRESAK